MKYENHGERPFSAYGKLLLFGEYFVLRGSPAVALPTKFSQSLEVTPTDNEGILLWESFNKNGTKWFHLIYDVTEQKVIETNNQQVSDRCLQYLRCINEQSPKISFSAKNMRFTLNFDREWGLGTSSSLAVLLGEFAKVDPFLLNQKVMGGSGYDVAVAKEGYPLRYQMTDEGKPKWTKINFSPSFREQLYFVYLGEKRNTTLAVDDVRSNIQSSQCLDKVSSLIHQVNEEMSFKDFSSLVRKWNTLLEKELALKSLPRKFSDYPWECKYLGAWGGDYGLFLSEDLEFSKQYFQKNVLTPIFSYDEIIKGKEKLSEA